MEIALNASPNTHTHRNMSQICTLETKRNIRKSGNNSIILIIFNEMHTMICMLIIKETEKIFSK